MSLVSIQNLVFEYPGKRALNDISLEISEGSITALVGPNGAGKTTLMKCISALDFPFSGQIAVDGMDTQKHPRECHKSLGFLPDFFGLYDDLSVRQHLIYIASARNVREYKIENRIVDIVKSLKLEAHVDKPASSLSRGLRQRLAIGMSIIHYPKLLLLDEPASGLDPEGRKDLSQLFKELNQQGITIIVSSHILAELEDYSTHMLICKDGEIVSSEEISTDQKTELSRFRLKCVDCIDACKEFLLKNEAIKHLEVNDRELSFEFSSEESEVSALLQSLIENKFKVVSFYAEKQNLQDLYLSQVKDD